MTKPLARDRFADLMKVWRSYDLAVRTAREMRRNDHAALDLEERALRAALRHFKVPVSIPVWDFTGRLLVR